MLKKGPPVILFDHNYFFPGLILPQFYYYKYPGDLCCIMLVV